MRNDEISDLSQPLYVGMPFLKNLGPFQSRHVLNLDANPVQITELTFTTHMGTHLDAPRHFFKEGATIDQIPLSWLTGNAIVIETKKEAFELITLDDVEKSGFLIEKGDFVFFKTGWSRRFDLPDYFEHPSISIELADWLVARGVRIVGVDFNGVDITGSRRKSDFNFPIHRKLLGNGILIIENLRLEDIAGGELNVYCFPINISGADAAQVRVVGIRPRRMR